MLTREEAFAQGARCGNIEGKGRADQYIINEEIELSWEAAGNQGFEEGLIVKVPWAEGYQHGYKLAAEGSELEEEYHL